MSWLPTGKLSNGNQFPPLCGTLHIKPAHMEVPDQSGQCLLGPTPLLQFFAKHVQENFQTMFTSLGGLSNLRKYTLFYQRRDCLPEAFSHVYSTRFCKKNVFSTGGVRLMSSLSMTWSQTLRSCGLLPQLNPRQPKFLQWYASISTSSFFEVLQNYQLRPQFKQCSA